MTDKKQEVSGRVEEVRPSKSHHARDGRQFRVILDDGRAVVVEEGWYVYPEDDPSNLSAGTLDGPTIAEFLGYAVNDDYPDVIDEWADHIKALTNRKTNATKNLEPGEEIQTTEKGLKIGVPKKSDFLAGIERASRSKKP